MSEIKTCLTKEAAKLNITYTEMTGFITPEKKVQYVDIKQVVTEVISCIQKKVEGQSNKKMKTDRGPISVKKIVTVTDFKLSYEFFQAILRLYSDQHECQQFVHQGLKELQTFCLNQLQAVITDPAKWKEDAEITALFSHISSLPRDFWKEEVLENFFKEMDLQKVLQCMPINPAGNVEEAFKTYGKLYGEEIFLFNTFDEDHMNFQLVTYLEHFNQSKKWTIKYDATGDDYAYNIKESGADCDLVLAYSQFKEFTRLLQTHEIETAIIVESTPDRVAPIKILGPLINWHEVEIRFGKRYEDESENSDFDIMSCDEVYPDEEMFDGDAPRPEQRINQPAADPFVSQLRDLYQSMKKEFEENGWQARIEKFTISSPYRFDIPDEILSTLRTFPSLQGNYDWQEGFDGKWIFQKR